MGSFFFSLRGDDLAKMIGNSAKTGENSVRMKGNSAKTK